jgi:hypothetical protein
MNRTPVPASGSSLSGKRLQTHFPAKAEEGRAGRHRQFEPLWQDVRD